MVAGRLLQVVPPFQNVGREYWRASRGTADIVWYSAAATKYFLRFKMQPDVLGKFLRRHRVVRCSCWLLLRTTLFSGGHKSTTVHQDRYGKNPVHKAVAIYGTRRILRSQPARTTVRPASCPVNPGRAHRAELGGRPSMRLLSAQLRRFDSPGASAVGWGFGKKLTAGRVARGRLFVRARDQRTPTEYRTCRRRRDSQRTPYSTVTPQKIS